MLSHRIKKKLNFELFLILFELFAQQSVDNRHKRICISELDGTLVLERGGTHIDGKLGENGDAEFLRNLVCGALAENVMLFVAVRTGEIAHILDKTYYGNIHH